MDRYQFEDLISDYIENNLSMSQRKEVESYLEDNPDAKAQLESVKTVMDSMKGLPNVSTSDDFMQNLNQRIQSEKEAKSKPRYTRTFAGYTPLMAGLSAVVVVAFIMLGMEFMPGENTPATFTPSMADESTDYNDLNPTQDNEQMFADTEEDSTNIDDDPPVKHNLNNRIQLVGDKRP